MTTRRAYGLTLLAALTYTSLMFCWFTLPAYLSTIQTELTLTGTQAGLVAGAVPLVYIPLALVSGLVVDRVGAGRSLSVGLAIVAVAQMARSVAGGFPSLLAATLLLGVGATAITFGLPKLVSTLFPAGETGAASSLYLLCASAGTAGAFSVGRPILGPALGGWRPLFLASGAVALGYALVWALVARAAVPAAETDSDFQLESLTADLRAILSNPALRLVVVLGVVYLSVLHGLQGWLPTILESRGMASGTAGQTATLLVVANAAGILTIPVLADRYDARRVAVVCCGAAVAVGVATIARTGVGVALLAGIVCTGLGVGGLSPLVRAIPPELDGIGPRLTGVAVGFVFAGGEVGGFGGPVVIGALYDATGTYATGLGLLCLGGLAAVAAGSRLDV
ncbi:MFS transporter [Halosegnis longus]|uniref:MFS transporter n=1 Tax=Halosegnis longus TaxID=2216012 RepID=A0AAJ4UWF6_9EURY|nr:MULTISPECIES: MFS transporter [Halobacteriales]RNJ27036.1 MFS transporter [Salella cibi]